MFGKVIYWVQSKGYGFIRDVSSDQQYFFHHSNFTKGDVPIAGSFVVFNLGQSSRPDKPVQAIGVKFATAEDIIQIKSLMASTVGADALKAGA